MNGHARQAERPPWQEAVAFAAREHRHQLRKDGRTPYVAHVFRVLLTVRDLFGCDDPDAMCAAVLHDTIEDTPADYDDLEERFGTTVADLVASLTKNMALREDAREADYDRRLASAGWRARLIKLADVYVNLCDAESRIDNDPGARDRLRARCVRAVTLAEPDAPAHPETARAIDMVRAAMRG